MSDIWPGSIEPPPAEYRTGEVTATIVQQSYADTDKQCKSYFPVPNNVSFYGCYVPQNDTIYVPYIKGWFERKLLEHEQAHARGWRHPPQKDWK